MASLESSLYSLSAHNSTPNLLAGVKHSSRLFCAVVTFHRRSVVESKLNSGCIDRPHTAQLRLKYHLRFDKGKRICRESIVLLTFSSMKNLVISKAVALSHIVKYLKNLSLYVDVMCPFYVCV